MTRPAAAPRPAETARLTTGSRDMRIRRGVLACAWLAMVAMGSPEAASGGDWPQWRCDAGRTAAAPEELPGRLHLQWVRQLPPPRPAWPKYPRLQFDASYEPVVMGKTMFVASMVTDSVTALDTATGAERWRFYAGGPVRFAPVAQDGKVYFICDDGLLYCLDAAGGRLRWTFRALPTGRTDAKVLGNERLISLWPARGGPVLADGTIYFAAGIWPFEGVYVYAVDAETGKAVWSNTDSGYIKDGLVDHGLKTGPRGASGLAPQGYLTVIGERLIVPCGRALPGFLDRKTGRRKPYLTGWGGRVSLAKGCWYVPAAGKYFAHTGDLCELATRAHLEVDPANRKEIGESRRVVLTEEVMYYSRPVNKSRRDSYRPVGAGWDRIVACDLTNPAVRVRKGRRGEDWKRATLRTLWSLPSALEVHIKAGRRLYAGAPGTVAAVDLPRQGKRAEVSWRTKIPGTPARMLAADGKLFVVTRQGAIHCFGADRAEPRRHDIAPDKPRPAPAPWARRAADALRQTTVQRIAASRPGEPTVAMRLDTRPVDVRWPTEWQVFGPLPKRSKLLPGSALKTIPAKLTLDGNDHLPRRLATVDDTLDFTCLYGGYGHKPLAPGARPTVFPRPGTRRDDKMPLKLAYAMAEIDCPSPGRLTIGAAADGRMAWYLDGNCIYDPNSNEGVWACYGLRGRLFTTDVSAGRHVLAAAVRAGWRGWDLASAGGAKPDAQFKASMAGISHTDVMQGYALVLGVGSGHLAEELARQSRMHVVVVEPDAAKAEAFRRRLDATGLYAARLAIVVGDPLTLRLPPYFADLVASEDLAPLLAAGAAETGRKLVSKVFGCLRPYGGVACLPVAADKQETFARWVKAAALPGAEVRRAGGLALLRRPAALPGSADWTHERADAANSFCSRERRVRTPLRVLWFGGSIDLLFPDWDFTHSRHPIPLVVGGRVFIQQAWTLAAADIFTGRLLWKVSLPAPRDRYHSYAAATDGVYVGCGGELLRLDPATGRTLARIRPPAGVPGAWREVAIRGNLLLGQVGRHLVAMDRRSGGVSWSHKCRDELTDFAVGGGRVFLADCPVPARGYKATPQARLIALDARSGQAAWTVPATLWVGPRSHPRLGYSEAGDLLVVEHRDVQAHRPADGKLLWHQPAKQAVPYVLHPEAIVNARTGEQYDPRTGEKRRRRLWSAKLRGCSHAVASEYVLTVRDGHATYFDLTSGRRMFLRGLRSGCTPSLIPADGLLNIPNFARGCSCNYAVFTSLALVPAGGGEE